MQITILGKRDQMGTTTNIRLRGLSGIRYDFLWDKSSRHYAYEPKNQKECDDIFRTQGKIYKTMFFSIQMDEKEEEPVKKAPAKKLGRPKKKQAVEEVA